MATSNSTRIYTSLTDAIARAGSLPGAGPRRSDRTRLSAVPGFRRGTPYAPEHNPDEFLNNDLKQAFARPHGSSPWAEGPCTPRDKAATSVNGV